jgi:hypothetical protein
VQKRRDRSQLAALLQIDLHAFDDEMRRRWKDVHR